MDVVEAGDAVEADSCLGLLLFDEGEFVRGVARYKDKQEEDH